MKIYLKVLVGILAVIALGIGIILISRRNEIGAILSIKKLREENAAHSDGRVYTMEVKGGFYFDEFLREGGVKSDRELISFIAEKMTCGLFDPGGETPQIGCSSFTSVSEMGDRLFGRNYDFAKTDTCILFTEGKGERYSSISTVDLQFVGIDPERGIETFKDKIYALAAPYAPLDGMNERGVCCGIYMTYQGEETVATNQNTKKPDITSTTMLRLILDYADSVDEAVELVKKYDLHDSAGTSYHYMVADATGKSAVLEWVIENDATDNDGGKRELKVIYNEGSFQTVTNFILYDGYYEGISKSRMKGLDRYEKMNEELKKTNGVVKDEGEAMKILKGVGRRGWGNDDANTNTIHSVVYNMTDKSVLWVSNENWDDESAVFEFEIKCTDHRRLTFGGRYI